MADFDPDAYLAQPSFDPDAYLKSAAKPERKTKSTYGDFATTLNEALKAAGKATSGQSQLGRGFQDVLDSAVLGSAWARDKLGGSGNYEAVKSDIDAINKDYETAVPNGSGMRLVSNIAATAPVGGVFGKVAEGLKAAPAVVSALRTSGMSTGVAPVGMAAKAGDLALKAGAGGAVGYGSAAMINPDDAATGGIVGAALPPALKFAGSVVPSAVKNVLGLTTGAGAENVAQAYKAGKAGNTAFMDNLTGKTSMSDVLDTVKQNAQNMGAKASSDYRSGMVDIKGDKSVLNFDEIDNSLKKAYDSITFKGQPKNVKAAEITQQIADEVGKWKNLDPTEFHTPEGLDALKQRIGGIIESIPFEDKTARMAASNIYNSIKDEISKQAPTYSKVMKNYSDSIEQIRDIEKTLSLNPKASVDTSLRKLQSLGRNNVNTNYGNRMDMAKTLEQAGGNEFLPAIAGQSMNSWASRGLAGQGGNLATLGASLANPAMLGLLPLQSPKAVGAMSYGAGKLAGLMNGTADQLTPESVNALAMILRRGATLAPVNRQKQASNQE